MAQRPFILPSGVDFYAGDGTAAGVADPLLVVSDSTNKVGINSQTPSGTLDINTASATDKGLIIRSSTSQTANLLEVQNSSSGTIYYIDRNGNQSGISASYQSGIILSNGVPSSTTSALYANGATLYWNGALISTGTVANALTLGSGLSSSTATTFNGSAVVTANLGGTGTLSSLYYPVDIIIGNSGTAFAVANGSTNRIFIGQNAGYAMSGSATVTNNSSIVIGNVAGAQSTFTASDQHSVLIGYAAGSGVTNTYSNIYIGGNAGISSSGGSTSAFNVAVGYNALGNAIYTTLARNAALGLYAGASSNGRQAVYLGAYAGYFATGLSNSYVGYQSAYQAQGGNNAAIGFNAFQYGTGNYVTALGNSAGSLVSGDYNLYVGYFAGYKATGVNNIEILASGNNSSNSIIGSNSNKLNIGNVLSGDTSTKKLYIGNVSNSTLSPTATLQIQANAATDKGLVIKSAASQSANVLEVQNSAGTAIFAIDNVGRAYQNIAGSGLNWGNTAFGGGALNGVTLAAGTNNSYCTAIGVNALQVANGSASNTCVGNEAGKNISTGSENTIIGTLAGTPITTQSYNTIVGSRAAQNATVGGIVAIGCIALNGVTTGGDNIGVGFQSAQKITTGSTNVAVGNYTMYQSTVGTMSYNTAIGINALRWNNFNYNTAIGYNTLYLSSGLSAGYNTALGAGAGYTLTTGSGNTFLGASTDVVSGSGAINGSIVIGYNAQANQNNQLVIGSSSFKVGKSDGTGEQTAVGTTPSGVSALLESRINGTVYKIPLLPSGATTLQATATLSGGGSGYLTYWNSTTTLGSSSFLRYDATNNRLVFTGTGVAASGMNMSILSDSTISFESTAGQLFSISDGLASGTIFSVNDISGMSSIEVDASGLIKLGEYDGYVGIGTSQTYGQYTGKVEINAPSGYKGLIVRPANGSTSNIFEVQNSSSGTILAITASGAISGAITPTIITSTGNITLDNTYNGYIIEQTGVASSGTFTLGTGITIPGWNCSIVNIGSGVIVASGSNTMRSPGGLNKSRTQYSTISIYRRGTNDFVLGGDLA